MTKKKVDPKPERKRFSVEFKQQALLCTVRDGVPATARDLGLEPAQIYAWRSQAQQHGQDAEAQRLRVSEQARLKRELARLEEEKRLPEKSGGVLREAAEVKYATMKAHEGQFQVQLMCRVLDVFIQAEHASLQQMRHKQHATFASTTHVGLIQQLSCDLVFFTLLFRHVLQVVVHRAALH